MNWFRRKSETVRFQIAEDGGSEPFSKWQITTPFSNGGVVTLRGYVDGQGDHSEALRYVDAIAEGLRSAGFDAEVTLTREEEVQR